MSNAGGVILDSPEVKEAIQKAIDEAVAGLKNKNSELLGELAKLKPLKDIDPDEYTKLKSLAGEIEEKRMRAAGEFDNLKKQLLDAHAKEKTEWEAERTKLRKSLEDNVLTRSAIEAITSEKGSPELLMPHLKSRTKLDDNGNVIVVDESGNVRVDAKGEPVTVSTLVAEMKQNAAFGRAFESTIPNGSGTPNNNGRPASGKTIQSAQFDAMNAKDRAATMAAGYTIID